MRHLGIALLFTAVSVSGQEAPAADAPTPTRLRKVIDWITTNVEVRQTFDGSKEEQKPATVAYVQNADVKDSFYQIDFAIRVGERDLARHSERHQLNLSPTAEWHRTSTPKPVDTISGKLQLEHIYGKLREYDEFGVEDTRVGGETDIGWVTVLRAGPVRDRQQNVTSGDASITFTIKSHRPGYPNSFVNLRDGSRIFRYAPHLGVDYYSNKPVFVGTTETAGIDLALARANLNMAFYPFNRDNTNRREILFEYTYFHHLAGDDRLGSMRFWTAQANYYLDQAGRVAIGYTYERGENPTKKFLRVRQSSVGLRIKL